MTDYRVSSRYAKSLIELASSMNLLDKVHNDLQLFLSTADQSRDLKIMLTSPVIKHVVKKRILRSIFEKHLDNLTLSFFDIICQKNREILLYSIAKEFHRQYNAVNGVEFAKVTTSVALTNELRTQFNKVVMEVSGKPSVELVEEVNPDIIGGFILNVGDRRIDGSVVGKLNRIKRKLVV